jgi:uncharacterized membrane protein
MTKKILVQPRLSLFMFIFFGLLLILFAAIPDQSAALDNLLTEYSTEEIQDETTSEQPSDLSLFFGRFHPVLVHLPIGFLLMAFLLEFVSMAKRYEQLNHAVPFVLLMGVLSAVFSAITGSLLSDGGGYGEDMLNLHKWLGIGTVLLSLAAWILRITLYDDPFYKRIYRVTLTVMVMVLIGAGHFGGSLTHGSDYLFRYMPEPVRSWIGIEEQEPEPVALIEDLETAHVYHDVIEPIFKARCQSCHDPDRTEGDLLMTSWDHLMAGGESGPPIEPYQSEESDLYRRLRLPDRHDDRMPPRGRTQLSPDQIRLIGWWIDQGAPSDPLVTELERPAEIQSILESLTVTGRPFFERVQVAHADPSLIEQAESRGFRIRPVSDGLAFLQVGTLQSKTDVTVEDMEALLLIADQISWLDLSRTNVSDTELEQLSEFRHLTRLYLQQTDVGDSTLSRIAELEHLEYLNLYGTDITDSGLHYLESLVQLQSLYLWQTAVTADAAYALESNLPGVTINTGAEF